ncbi:MAG: AgmX/PglI C-terminal domain-containing protein [Deltaproteobacteria bacterium]|nr:AgmX/PglI C-terminal domain-containing protein [Deltaproteobacteria bacterium]
MSQASELEVIVFKPGGGLLASTVHSETRIVIGKGQGCTIVINDPTLADEHAVVHFTGRSVIIEALPGGSLVANGDAAESHLIQPQDTITLGKHTLRFVVHRVSGQAQVAAPAPVAAPTLVPAPAPAPVATTKSSPAATAAAAATTLEEAPKTRVLRVAPATAPEAKREPEKQREPEKKPEAEKKPEKKPQRAPDPEPVTEPVTRDPDPEPADRTRVDRLPPGIRAPAAAAVALKPAFEHDAHPDEEEDEDDDEPFVAFSLVDAMFETGKHRVPGEGTKVVEAVRERDGRVVKILHIARGRNMRLSSPVPLQCTHEDDGTFVVRGLKTLAGKATKGGKELAIQTLSKKGSDGPELRVTPGTSVKLELSPREVLLLQHTERAVPVPLPPPASFKAPSLEDQRVIIAAFVFHIIAFIILGLSTPSKEGVMDPNEGRYVEVKIKDLELEPPPPQPEPEPIPVQPEPQPQAKTPPKKQPKSPKPSASPTPPPAPQKSAAAQSLLSALGGGLTSPAAPSAAASTNLDAVAAPKGAGFKVSGAIGKMAGTEMKLGAAGSGVGRIDTKSANELTKGGTLGRVQGSAPSGKVRGVVDAPPARSVQVQGSLDRSEIQKVVNDHLHEVQGCYERQLVKDASLAGKIVSEWVITPNGTVGTVKIKSSTVRNNEVSSCIQNALKRWKFPQPKGGPVTVTYPFVFSTIGM